MRIVWDVVASADIIGIWRYIRHDDDRPIAASDVFARIQNGVEILAQTPEIGRRGKLPRTRELVLADLPYIAIYRIDQRRKIVVIMRIIHTAQEWPPKS